MEQIERFLKIGASAVAIVVPCILLSGFSYHIGNIFTFGLSHELINKDMTDVIVESWYIGVLAMAWLLSKWLYWLGFFVLLIMIGLVAFFTARHVKENGKEWLFEKLSRENQGRKILGITQWHWCQLGALFSETGSWFFYPLLVIAIVSVFTFYPYQRGEADANKQLKIYAESGCLSKDKIVQCVYLIDTNRVENKVIAKGILVSANDKKVALYNNKLEVWPLLDSYMIRKNIAVEISKKAEIK